MSITNLATNPSFETASGTVEVRRNLARNPDANSITNWSNVGGATHTRTADTTFGYNGSTSIRYDLTGSGALGGKVNIDGGITSGETVVWETWVFSSKPQSIQPYWERSSPSYAGGNGGPAVSVLANTWTRITGSVTFSSTQADPAGTFGFGVFAASSTAWVSGDKFWLDAALIEKASILGSYFDGSTAAAGDFTHAWVGTVNGSASVQNGSGFPAPSSGQASKSIRSTAWFSSGSKSLRNIPTTSASATFPGGTGFAFGMAAGKTYTALVKLRLAAAQTGTLSDYARRVAVFNGGTLIARTDQAPNTAGEHELRLSFTVPASATSAYVVLYNGSSETEVWWDGLLVVEGEYVGPYFDGDTPTVANARYAWTGTAHASTSTYTFRGLTLEPLDTAPCPRVGVTVEGLSPGDHEITVWRTADGERNPVPGIRTVKVIDSFFEQDFAAPLGRTVHYELEILSGPDAGLQGLRATTQLDSSSGWIHDPMNPASAVPVSGKRTAGGETYFRSQAFSTMAYQANVSQHLVMGDTRPVSISGPRMAPSGVPLSVSTQAEAENVRLRDLVRGAVHLVIRPLPEWGSHIPGTATYSVADAEEQPFDVSWGGSLTRWQLSGDVVRPSAARVLIALWRYLDVAAIFSTYDQKQATAGKGTYLDDQKNPANTS